MARDKSEQVRSWTIKGYDKATGKKLQQRFRGTADAAQDMADDLKSLGWTIITIDRRS